MKYSHVENPRGVAETLAGSFARHPLAEWRGGALGNRGLDQR